MINLNNAANLFSGSIPTVFGNGLIGTAVTGLVRIPTFMSNCVAVLMVGELTIRGLSETLSSFGIKQNDDSFISKCSSSINISGIRPYKKYSNKQLLTSAIAFAALGILGSEFVRITGGPTPAIYNNVLAFLGPLRISNAPYLTVIGHMLGKNW